MRILPVKREDISQYRQMDLDLDSDYLDHVFDMLADSGLFYKAVQNGRMVGVASLGEVNHRCAYLGSARVDVNYRGRGIATALGRCLIGVAEKRGYRWVGLCTDEENTPAKKAAEKLGLTLLGRHESLHRHGEIEMLKEPQSAVRHLRATKKSLALQQWCADTGLLPLGPYWIVPLGEGLDTEYLENLRMKEVNAGGEHHTYFINGATRLGLHILLAGSACDFTPCIIREILTEEYRRHDSVHVGFLVHSGATADDDSPAPEGWRFHRWCIYGRNLRESSAPTQPYS